LLRDIPVSRPEFASSLRPINGYTPSLGLAVNPCVRNRTFALVRKLLKKTPIAKGCASCVDIASIRAPVKQEAYPEAPAFLFSSFSSLTCLPPPHTIDSVTKEKEFVHLHTHTKYSLLDGACHLEDLISTALSHNMPAIAMTDHGVMYGAVDFYLEAQKQGITPIIGCEVYITPESRFDRGQTSEHRVPINHLVLLASNNVGYHNLLKLVSAAQLEGFYYKPRIDKEILSQHSEGLIGLSACLKGEVAGALTNDGMDAGIKAAGVYTDILGKDNFFLEVMDHSLPEQRKLNKLLKTLSQKTDIPLVATNDVHYLKKEHAEAHEVLLCLQTQSVMTDPNHMRFSTQEFYLKTREQMETLCREYPEAVDKTVEIASRCNLEMEFDKLHFPKFDIPDGQKAEDYLVQLCKEGIQRLYNVSDPNHPKDDGEREVMDRCYRELGVISKTGFVNYFLVVWDFIHFAREQGIPVGPGRGSGGGSLVAYVLGITTIDPLHYKLIFERFLNPERVSPPDFDIDFCQSRRGEVIEYVRNKYGTENVAQIITFGSLGAKSVIRDVGRVLEISYADCDRLSKMIPNDPKIKLKDAIAASPDFAKASKQDENCQRILKYAFVLEGLYRNPGTHAAGVVIGEKPLRELIPLTRDKDKQTITQYTMEPLGKIGLLKMDFLGLKTLTVMQEAVELIKELHDVDIDLENLPLDDKLTYELFNRGDTIGVFQLESQGMRDLCRRIGVNAITDLIAMIALYRPGPMNMLPSYVNRKTGNEKVRYDHELMAPILEETYGVMVYQEQVQAAANVLAGYTLGQADILRRAMGKKKKSEMDSQRKNFVEGCAKTNKIQAKKAGKIFDTMAEFAGYGFNKAHSAGYAIIAYQTAYLKANRPAEFMSALLSSEIGNSDKLPIFIAETRNMGLEVLAPDVNSSNARFRPTPDGKGILFGLAGIKNVGEAAAEAIRKERLENGPFSGLLDFCSRIDSQSANKKVIESLARAGACDSFNIHRAKIFNGIDFAMSRAASVLSDKQRGQANLFDMMGEEETDKTTDDLPECPEWHESDMLSAERELLGMYMSGHPLTRHAWTLQRYQLSTVENFQQLADRTITRLGGIVTLVDKRTTKRQEPMAVMQLEDLDGSIEAIAWPEAYREFGVHIEEGAAILVCGEVSKKNDDPRLIIQEIYPLSETPRHFSKRVSIHIPTSGLDDPKIKRVGELLRMHPGDVPILICLIFPTGEKVFLDTDHSFNVLPSEELLHDIEHELGENSLYIAVEPKPCLRPKKKRTFGNYKGNGN
jgi:DNA polymerase-3 subunit alpha